MLLQGCGASAEGPNKTGNASPARQKEVQQGEGRARPWTHPSERVKSLAPDERSIPAAREVLKKGGFGTVEATADGRGWWVICRGLTDTYQVSSAPARAGDGRRVADSTANAHCPSYKNPCKHALAPLLYLVEHPEMRHFQAEVPKTAASDFEGFYAGGFR